MKLFFDFFVCIYPPDMQESIGRYGTRGKYYINLFKIISGHPISNVVFLGKACLNLSEHDLACHFDACINITE